MITYVNSKEAKLFELAAKDLGETSLDLDQYLNNLGRLRAISPKYVRLPLYEEGHEDEEVFFIDANERAIKIPSSFSKNGVGVVSDEFAEILWFKINRYFDIKDFGKASDAESLQDGDLHILIQWEAPDGAKGASYAFAIDKDTDPDFIYFGWAITAQHLTAKAGNIRFAVRIMQYGADGIDYSFATQSAAVAVKANLSFDLTEEDVVIENVADKIASRLMGGQIAHCPVFAEENGDLPPYVLNLAVPDGAAEGTPAQAVLTVVAAAPEGEAYDAMAYKWYKKGANDEEFSQIEGEYTPALTVTSSGEYYVVVFGMNEIIDNKEYIYDGEAASEEPLKFKYHTSVASSKSTVCEIPAPIKLEIVEDVVDHLVLENDPQILIVVKRQKIGEDTVGEVALKFEKTASAEKDLDLETAEFVEVGEGSEGSAAISEAWIYDGVEYATEEEAKAALEIANPLPEGLDYDYSAIEHREAQDAIPGTPGITYAVDDTNILINMTNAEEGYYKITVINKLNGDQEDSEPVIVCRVVKPAKVDAAAAIILDARGNEVSPKGSIVVQDRISANVTINGLSDELKIKWYKVAGGHQDQDPPVEGDLSLDILIEGANELVYQPDDDGFFYYVAINKVEESEFALASNVVEFTA